jgi:hypothetical protein
MKFVKPVYFYFFVLSTLVPFCLGNNSTTAITNRHNDTMKEGNDPAATTSASTIFLDRESESQGGGGTDHKGMFYNKKQIKFSEPMPTSAVHSVSPSGVPTVRMPSKGKEKGRKVRSIMH